MIPDEVFVIDSVAHAYNLAESNFRVPEYAEPITNMIYGTFMAASPTELTLTEEQYNRDWGIEEAATMLFLESQTDIAVYHPTPINVYEDGLNSVDKAKEALDRWPNRFLSMATVDPLEGEEGLKKVEQQAAELDPVGLKLYPSSWTIDGSYDSWMMSDEDVAYPFFEKAVELGLPLVSVHKSLPLGAVPMDAFHHEDVESAATSFPELNFGLVHGGMVFTEEVAWQLARYENIFVNIEVLSYHAHARPKYFEETFAGLFEVAGEGAVDKIYWGTGCMAYPAQPQLEAFWDFEFSEDLLDQGLFDIPQMTPENKQKILADNYAQVVGLDIEQLKTGIEGDEFEKQRGGSLAKPYSTTAVG